MVTWRLDLCVLLMGWFLLPAFGQVRAESEPKPPQARTIHGVVKSGNMPIPGAAVSISLGSSPEKIFAWTEVDGSYWVTVSSYGDPSIIQPMDSWGIIELGTRHAQTRRHNRHCQHQPPRLSPRYLRFGSAPPGRAPCNHAARWR